MPYDKYIIPNLSPKKTYPILDLSKTIFHHLCDKTIKSLQNASRNRKRKITSSLFIQPQEFLLQLNNQLIDLLMEIQAILQSNKPNISNSPTNEARLVTSGEIEKHIKKIKKLTRLCSENTKATLAPFLQKYAELVNLHLTEKNNKREKISQEKTTCLLTVGDTDLDNVKETQLYLIDKLGNSYGALVPTKLYNGYILHVMLKGQRKRSHPLNQKTFNDFSKYFDSIHVLRKQFTSNKEKILQLDPLLKHTPDHQTP